MNKNIYIAGISVLALALGGLPVVALAEVQARFQVLAEKEQSRWGIFSWSF